MRGASVALPILVFLLPSPTRSGVTWDPIEVVDTPVDEVSTSSGVSVLNVGGLWQVVYVKGGEVYHRPHTGSGWGAALQLSTASGTALSPHLAEGGGFVHVVWEESGPLRSDVWTRRFDGAVWLPEECLTCTDSSSRTPVVGGSGSIAFAAWEAESLTGVPAIRGRRFENEAWAALEVISEGTADAIEPSVSVRPEFITTTFVAWSDARHGDPEIYVRVHDGLNGPGWSAEERLTNMTGSCRRPSIHSEGPTTDFVTDDFHVVFENDQDIVNEVYGICRYETGTIGPELLSASDGVPSVRPNLGGFRFQQLVCDLGFGNDNHVGFATWTDTAVLSTHQLLETSCPPYGTSTTSFGPGDSYSVVGAIEGDPEAQVMILWVDSSGPTLVSQLGRLPGYCRRVFEDPPPVFAIGPEGNPSNTLHLVDSCTGAPAEYANIWLTMEPALEAALVFDPESGDPPYYQFSDENGMVTFVIRGGGCSQAGTAKATCVDGSSEHVWPGVKSPDVNGDCVVDQTDADYIDSVFGTDDFCGDLDGSGSVDLADVSIVAATMGEHCSTTDAGALPAAVRLAVTPTPARAYVTILIETPVPGSVRARIVDASGRLVRDLGERDVTAGATTLAWDARNGAGRRVASGKYFVVLRFGSSILRHAILLVR